MNHQQLNKLHRKIDTIDDQILSLLDQRMIVTGEIASVKNKLELPLRDTDRECAIIKRLQKQAKHPLLEDSISSIFFPIFDCAKAKRKLMQREKISIKRIGILGLGLIGGSILKALKMRGGGVVVSSVERDDKDTEAARENGLIDHLYKNLEELISNVECLVLAVPIAALPNLAQHAAKHNKPLLVLDVASVKGEVAALFESLTSNNVEFVATHPMAGSEKSGFDHSSPRMFIHAPWAITPHSRNTKQGLDAAKEVIEYLGAQPLELEASTHDQYAALVSHVPGILAKSYLDFVDRTQPDAHSLKGPGFRSFTRIANGNPPLRQEIFHANRKMIVQVLSKWINEVSKLFLKESL